jgi:hypothetical protein
MSFRTLRAPTAPHSRRPRPGYGVLVTAVGARLLPRRDPSGRRPAVDTFLVFLNLVNGDTKSAPVGIVIRFGPNGETVDQTTFHATLNGTDVTASFLPGSQAGHDENSHRRRSRDLHRSALEPSPRRRRRARVPVAVARREVAPAVVGR